MANTNKLQKILQEDFEQKFAKKADLGFDINQKAMINNAINNFDIQPYREKLIEVKKKLEDEFAQKLYEYATSTMGVHVSIEGIKEVLYNMDVKVTLTLFKDVNFEFENNAFVDALQDVIMNQIGK